MKKIAFLIISILVLSGCAAGLDEDYSCTAVGGVSGCTSMDQVRNNIHLYTSQNNSGTFNANVAAQATPSSFTLLPRRDRHGTPSRTENVVKKVTIFPFIDVKGNYVDTTDMFIILDDSHWTGRPASAIWRD
ncbi:type IV conjugative transfer system lipoprotein TraV [Vibrio parahaemolyticus]|nr:type IV conjugative transfer system lipoprotein TraV [Vibrio parahaemolyticus]